MRTKAVSTLVTLTAVLALSSCAETGSGADGSEAGGKPAVPALPSENRADQSKPPIILGMYNAENVTTAGAARPEARLGAQAAVQYINTYLGGVQGRPLKLETCISNGTAAGSASCASELIAKDVVSVTLGFDGIGGGSGAVSVLEKAKVPLVGGVPAGAEGQSRNAFFFDAGAPGLTAGIAYSVTKILGHKQVSILGSEIQTFTLNLFKATAQALGGRVKVIAIPTGTTDFTASMVQANSARPEAIVDLQGICPAIPQLKNQMGIQADLFESVSCSTPGQLKATGAALEGTYFVNQYRLNTDTKDPDMAAFLAAMNKFNPKAELSNFSKNGFQSMMNIRALADQLTKSGKKINPANLTELLKTSTDRPNFLGETYTCDGKQFPGLAGVCNSKGRLTRYQDGKLVDTGKGVKGWISGAEYAPAGVSG